MHTGGTVCTARSCAALAPTGHTGIAAGTADARAQGDDAGAAGSLSASAARPSSGYSVTAESAATVTARATTVLQSLEMDARARAVQM